MVRHADLTWDAWTKRRFRCGIHFPAAKHTPVRPSARREKSLIIGNTGSANHRDTNAELMLPQLRLPDATIRGSPPDVASHLISIAIMVSGG
jgi:hypothetical protein